MKIWQHLAAIAIITIFSAIIYMCVQQSYRSNANDPQIQLANDLKTKAEKGQLPEDIFADTIELSHSLNVFVETFDEEGRPLRSNGLLDGKLPRLPQGVIDHAKE